MTNAQALAQAITSNQTRVIEQGGPYQSTVAMDFSFQSLTTKYAIRISVSFGDRRRLRILLAFIAASGIPCEWTEYAGWINSDFVIRTNEEGKERIRRAYCEKDG